MLVGYNHNVCYGGHIFHAQTEACGEDHPVIVTHLFLQGMVVASLRSSYQALLGDPQLDDKLRRAMQQQHKEILKQLRRGAFDDRSSRPSGEAAAPEGVAEIDDERTEVSPPPQEGEALAPQPGLGTMSGPELVTEPVSEIEKRLIARGQSVSVRLALVPVVPQGHIPFDHPAFEGFPMLELDGLGEEVLELDLDAIGAVPRQLGQADLGLPTVPGLAGAEEALELAELPPLQPRPEPPADPEQEATAALPDLPPVEPTPARRLGDAARDQTQSPQRPRAKRPSLPVAPVAVELPEGIDTRRRGR